MTGDAANSEGPMFTGEEAQERLVLCVQCERFREMYPSGQPMCQHDDDEARTLDSLTDAEYANIKLRAYKRELQREPEPRVNEVLLQSNIMSLASDLAWAGELDDMPEDIQ